MKEVKEGEVVNYRTPTGDIVEIEIKSLWKNKDSKGHDMVYEKKYDTGGSLYSLGKQKNIVTSEINKKIQRGDIFKVKTDFSSEYFMLVQTGYVKARFREDDYAGGYYLVNLENGNRLTDNPFAIDLKRKDIIAYLDYWTSYDSIEYVDVKLDKALNNYI